MEDKLQNLRNAMNRTVFEESLFTDAERRKIRVAVKIQEPAPKSVWLPKLVSAAVFITMLFLSFDYLQGKFDRNEDSKSANLENNAKQESNQIVDDDGTTTRWTWHPEESAKGFFTGFGDTGTIIDDTKGFMLNSIVIYKSQFESFDDFINSVRPIKFYKENNHIQGVIVYINYFEQEDLIPPDHREDVLELQRQAQNVFDAQNEKEAKKPIEAYNRLLEQLKKQN